MYIRYATAFVVVNLAVALAVAAAGAPITPKAVKTDAGGTRVTGTPGGFVLRSTGAGLPKGWYKAQGENCYLVYSDWGILGGIGYVEDYGFHYDLDVYSDPEHYEGLYAWTDSPGLLDYEPYVYTATATPEAVSLPGSATSIEVRYAAKWAIETDYDGCELVYSTTPPNNNNPEVWQNLQATSTVPGAGTVGQPETGDYYYEDKSADWVPGETADVTFLAGQDVYFGFVFRSDQSNPEIMDGIYIDNFEVVADGTNVLYSNDFDDKPMDEWDSFRYTSYGTEDWDFTEGLPMEMNFLRSGEFVVGNSATAGGVADAYTPDWGFIKKYQIDGHQVVVFSNSGKVQIGDPEYEVSAHVYPQIDFVLVDCYVKSLRQGTTNNIYAGVVMWMGIKHNEYETFNDDVVTYDSSRDMAVFKDPGGEGESLVGLAYLTEGSTSTSVNFANTIDFTDDVQTYTLMSNGEHDYNGVNSPEKYWFVVVGEGPHALTRCQTFRYTFALIGGDNLTNLFYNYDNFAEPFSQSIDDYTPVNITEKSLGVIKSMFR